MRYLIFIIVFAAAYYLAKYEAEVEQTEIVEQEVDEIITTIDDIESAESIDEVIESTENFNKNASEQLHLLKEKAKSSASLEFVALTEKQNALADRGMVLSRNMQPFVNSLTPELTNDPEKLPAVLNPLCKNLSEYIPVFSEIVQTIGAKYELLIKQPIISTELMDGQHDKAKELLLHMYASQTRILEQEKQAYTHLQCDSYLTPNK